jgi:hypothetical protein
MMAVRFAKEALVCLSNHGRADFFGPSLLAPAPSLLFSVVVFSTSDFGTAQLLVGVVE